MIQYRREYSSVLVALAVAASISGCDLFGSDVAPRPNPTDPGPKSWTMPSGGLPYELPRIDMERRSGGFGGESDDISIMPGGVFIKRLGMAIPELSRQLSDNEYSYVISLFSGFLGYDNNVGSGCADAESYALTISNVYYTKTVNTDCGLHIHDPEPSIEYANIVRLITEINRLSSVTLETQAPWIGLEADFWLNRTRYSVGSSIQLNFELENPTAMTRAVYLPWTDKFWFIIYRNRKIFQTGRSDQVCMSGEGATCFPRIVLILPGESIVISETYALEDLNIGVFYTPREYRIRVFLNSMPDIYPPAEVTFSVVP